jgi:hypothetical protein
MSITLGKRKKQELHFAKNFICNFKVGDTKEI